LFHRLPKRLHRRKIACVLFLEPNWNSIGNRQRPDYIVALGEQLILDTCRAVAAGQTGPKRF
jgi:hypothetical protein